MRKAIFLFILVLGAGLGYLPARHEDWGVRVVMMVLGMLLGGAIGGALSQVGKRQRLLRRAPTEEELNPITGMGTSGRDLAANYWRDEGHPPFMKPPHSEYGNRMHDADKSL